MQERAIIGKDVEAATQKARTTRAKAEKIAKTRGPKGMVIPEEGKRLWHLIMGDRNFDLAKLIDELPEWKPLLEEKSNFHKQYLLSWWWSSDPETRRPASIEGVAKLLSVGKAIILRWLETRTFKDCLNSRRRDRIALLLPHLDKVAAQLALAGSKDAASYLKRLDGGLDERAAVRVQRQLAPEENGEDRTGNEMCFDEFESEDFDSVEEEVGGRIDKYQ
jgi:hypothetical protein